MCVTRKKKLPLEGVISRHFLQPRKLSILERCEEGEETSAQRTGGAVAAFQSIAHLQFS